jgi:hypothetical protein
MASRTATTVPVAAVRNSRLSMPNASPFRTPTQGPFCARIDKSGCKGGSPPHRSRCTSPPTAAQGPTPVAAGWRRVWPFLPGCPSLLERGTMLSVVKDIARRVAMAERRAGAIPERGCARRLAVIWPGRRNGAQPNRVTSDDRQGRSLLPTLNSEEARKFCLYNKHAAHPVGNLHP